MNGGCTCGAPISRRHLRHRLKESSHPVVDEDARKANQHHRLDDERDGEPLEPTARAVRRPPEVLEGDDQSGASHPLDRHVESGPGCAAGARACQVRRR